MSKMHDNVILSMHRECCMHSTVTQCKLLCPHWLILTIAFYIVSNNVGVSAGGELVWNQTDTTYTFKAKWTVPRTYNLPETITRFTFCKLSRLGPHFSFCDQNFNQIVPAVSLHASCLRVHACGCICTIVRIACVCRVTTKLGWFACSSSIALHMYN